MQPIDLYCEDASAFIERCRAAGVRSPCLHVDPPWAFRGGKTRRGGAATHYDGLPDGVIAGHLASLAAVATDNAYLFVWVTIPKLVEWLTCDPVMRAAGWSYISGAVWGKPNGLGVGWHFRGDAELLLVYKRGKMMPVDGSQSNLWIDPDFGPLVADWADQQNNFLLADRLGHSEKPQAALLDIIHMATQPGDLVLELYAGEFASLPRACVTSGRAYAGCELDKDRHAASLHILAQPTLALDAAYAPPVVTQPALL